MSAAAWLGVCLEFAQCPAPETTGCGNLVKPSMKHMGGCQNYGPFLGTLNIRCRILLGIQKGTIILTTPHIDFQDDPTHLAKALRPQLQILMHPCRKQPNMVRDSNIASWQISVSFSGSS